MTASTPRNRKRVALNAARRERQVRQVVYALIDDAHMRVHRYRPALGPLEVASWVAVVWVILVALAGLQGLADVFLRP